MPSAYKVMSSSQSPEISHSFFDQGAHRWEKMFDGKLVERESGVCAGLCLRWIKSSHHDKLIAKLNAAMNNAQDKKAKAIRKSIETQQDKSVAWSKAEEIPARGAGGFGARTVYRFGGDVFFVRSQDFPEQQGMGFPDYRQLIHQLGIAVANDYAAFEYASIVSLDFDAESAGHDIAVIAAPDRVQLFDPNGGVLLFSSKAACRKWFSTRFGEIESQVATDKVHRYGHDKTLITIVYYVFDLAHRTRG